MCNISRTPRYHPVPQERNELRMVLVASLPVNLILKEDDTDHPKSWHTVSDLIVGTGDRLVLSACPK